MRKRGVEPTPKKVNPPNKKYDFMTWVDPTLEDLQLRLEFQSGGFQKWGNPKMLGLFPGKSHLKMDDVSGVALFQETTI